MKTIEEFYSDVMANEETQKAYNEAIEAGKADEFLKLQGVSCTSREYSKFAIMHANHTNCELTDDEVVEAVGGTNWADGGYGWATPEEVEYLFSIGQPVYRWDVICNEKAVVEKRWAQQYWGWYYPIYAIRYLGAQTVSEAWQNHLAPR